MLSIYLKKRSRREDTSGKTENLDERKLHNQVDKKKIMTMNTNEVKNREQVSEKDERLVVIERKGSRGERYWRQ